MGCKFKVGQLWKDGVGDAWRIDKITSDGFGAPVVALLEGSLATMAYFTGDGFRYLTHNGAYATAASKMNLVELVEDVPTEEPDAVTTELDELRSQVSDRFDHMNAAMEIMRQEFEAKRESSREFTDTLNCRIDELGHELRKLVAGQVSELESRLDARITKLTKQNKKLKGRVNALENLVAALHGDVKLLRNRFNETTVTVDALHRQHAFERRLIEESSFEDCAVFPDKGQPGYMVEGGVYLNGNGLEVRIERNTCGSVYPWTGTWLTGDRMSGFTSSGDYWTNGKEDDDNLVRRIR